MGPLRLRLQFSVASENRPLGYLYQRFNLTINMGEGSLLLVAQKFSMNSR